MEGRHRRAGRLGRDDDDIGRPAGGRHGERALGQHDGNGDYRARRQPGRNRARRDVAHADANAHPYADTHPYTYGHADADAYGHAHPHDALGHRRGFLHPLHVGRLGLRGHRRRLVDPDRAADRLLGEWRPGTDVGGGGSERVIHLPAISLKDVDARAELSFTGVSGTGGVYSYLLVRRQAGRDYLRLGLYATAAGKLFLRGQAANGTTLFSDVDTGLAFTANTGYALRVQAQGSAPTTVRLKAWKAGTAEPSAWKVTATTTVGPQVTGSVGIRSANTTGTATTGRADNLSVAASPSPERRRALSGGINAA